MGAEREPIAVIGTGYVGLVTAAGFAELGNDVYCVDVDADKVARLERGEIPIYEPGLEEVIHRNVSAHRLWFSGSIREGVDNSQIVFIAVPTPQQPNGDVDLSFIEKVAREIAGVLTSYRVIVDLISTTTTDTGLKVHCELDANAYLKGISVSDADMNSINMTRDEFHGEWNYTIRPCNRSDRAVDS